MGVADFARTLIDFLVLGKIACFLYTASKDLIDFIADPYFDLKIVLSSL